MIRIVRAKKLWRLDGSEIPLLSLAGIGANECRRRVRVRLVFLLPAPLVRHNGRFFDSEQNVLVRGRMMLRVRHGTGVLRYGPGGFRLRQRRGRVDAFRGGKCRRPRATTYYTWVQSDIFFCRQPTTVKNVGTQKLILSGRIGSMQMKLNWARSAGSTSLLAVVTDPHYE
jgi:hypothetical protein